MASGGNSAARVLTGSALTEADGETDIGNFGIFEAAGEAELRAVLHADPFTMADIVDSVDIVRLPDRFRRTVSSHCQAEGSDTSCCPVCAYRSLPDMRRTHRMHAPEVGQAG